MLESPDASLRPPPPALTPIAVLATAACADTDPPVAPVAESATAVVQTDLRPDRGTIDDRWAAISQGEVPGFAGLWYDDTTGEIVVAATRADSRSAASGLASRSSAARDFPDAPVRFEVVSYDFLQLRTWKTAARALLRLPDVLYIDADEVRNRLVLGVSRSAETSQIREQTRALEIPDAGVEFVITSPSGFNGGSLNSPAATETGASPRSSSLTDKVRPTQGGLEIRSSRAACTLGFNALLAGEGDDPYFATASHCSADQFDPDTGIFRQDENGTRVGRESHDLVPQTGTFSFNGESHDCTSTPCRFSDVSLVAYDDTIDGGDVDLGQIAFTAENSTTISGDRSVTAKRHLSTLYIGLKVEMVGKETGRTKGDITSTCVDWPSDGPVTLDLLCQYRADYESVDGDSGAPVYVLRPNGTVSLIGVHSANPDDSQFSTLAGIEEDLGVTLEVCIPSGCTASAPALDVEIGGLSEVQEYSSCLYTADATGGFPPYAYRWFIDGDSVLVGGAQEDLEIEDVEDQNFLVEVRVIDDMNATSWDDLAVDVSPTHPGCPPIL